MFSNNTETNVSPFPFYVDTLFTVGNYVETKIRILLVRNPRSFAKIVQKKKKKVIGITVLYNRGGRCTPVGQKKKALRVVGKPEKKK